MLLPFIGPKLIPSGASSSRRLARSGRQSGVVDPRRGAIFAAWPARYAAIFSAFYLAMMLALGRTHFVARGLQISEQDARRPLARQWDWALFVGVLVPSLFFGVAMDNLLEGVPFQFRFRAACNLCLWSLPPVESVCIALRARQRGDVGDSRRGISCGQDRGDRRAACPHDFAFCRPCRGSCCFQPQGSGFGPATSGFAITTGAAPVGMPTPSPDRHRYRAVPGFANYALLAGDATRARRPASLAPLVGRRHGPARAGGWTVSWPAPWEFPGVIGTMGVSCFRSRRPLPRTPKSSLTVWDASSSYRTLGIMLIATLIFSTV